MKVLIYAPLAVLGHHFETDLEIAENHLLKGDDVTIIRCNGDLRPLGFMACSGAFRCKLCNSRCGSGTSLLSNQGKLKIIELGPVSNRERSVDINLSSIDEIKSFNYKDCDVGSAYMSSLISKLRDPAPEMKLRVNDAKNVLSFLMNLTDRFEEILTSQSPDLVYMFNGRFCLYRSLLRLCQNKNIKVFVHERASMNSKYSLTLNHMPHHVETAQRSFTNTWEQSSLPHDEKVKIASNWYEGNAKGVATSWHSFVGHQNISELPIGWNSEKRNIAVFVSSDDEFASIPGWELPFFPSQSLALEYILSHFSHNPNIHFYIRIHPNLRGLNNKSITNLTKLGEQYQNCTVIGAGSSVSTYKLLFSTEKTITFGSTIGMEAAYWGKPSILLGEAFYKTFDVSHVPRNKEEILGLIENSDLAAGSKQGALLCGFWSATTGIPFRHYRPKNLTTGSFKNTIVLGNRFYMFMNYFFVAIGDIFKILKGEYGLWHFKEKIKHKLQLLKKTP